MPNKMELANNVRPFDRFVNDEGVLNADCCRLVTLTMKVFAIAIQALVSFNRGVDRTKQGVVVFD